MSTRAASCAVPLIRLSLRALTLPRGELMLDCGSAAAGGGVVPPPGGGVVPPPGGGVVPPPGGGVLPSGSVTVAQAANSDVCPAVVAVTVALTIVPAARSVSSTTSIAAVPAAATRIDLIAIGVAPSPEPLGSHAASVVNSRSYWPAAAAVSVPVTCSLPLSRTTAVDRGRVTADAGRAGVDAEAAVGGDRVAAQQRRRSRCAYTRAAVGADRVAEHDRVAGVDEDAVARVAGDRVALARARAADLAAGRRDDDAGRAVGHRTRAVGQGADAVVGDDVGAGEQPQARAAVPRERVVEDLRLRRRRC